MKESYQIDFEPIGIRGTYDTNQSLLEIALSFGIEIANLCAGKGTCHNCKVQILSGEVSKPTANEREVFSDRELKNGWRLACQVYLKSDCKVGVPAESLTTPQRIQLESLQVKVIPEPSVLGYNLKLSPPTSGKRGLGSQVRESDTRDDAQRLLETLNQSQRRSDTSTTYRLSFCHRIDIDVLRCLSPLLRSLNWQTRVFVRDDEVISVGNWADKHLGLAIDLGTTKIAGYLLDLSSGKTLATKGIMNPQISYGEDIISRMTFIGNSLSNAKKIQELTVNSLNQFAAELCSEIEATPEQIVDVAIAGNTAMHHLLLGLPVEQLGLSPYVSTVSNSLDLKSRDVGLKIAPGAYLHTMPNIAGFVGGDHVAMLLATDAWRAEDLTIALDIGTNTEVSLICNGEITSVSCASGPAFEGAHIKDGMRAANGAIERLRFVNNRIEYQTIGGHPPIGLCGSGILDAIAQLYLTGILDFRGKMGNHSRVRIKDGVREFVLISEEERKLEGEWQRGKEAKGQGVIAILPSCHSLEAESRKPNGEKAITITQHDVREIQLAKGAIQAGIQVLLDKKGYSKDDIQKVIIAGAFGSYIDVKNAIAIGMLPDIPLDRFEQVGNAAGMGVKMVLISRSMRTEAENLAKKVHYIDLTAEPGFNKTFARATYFHNM